MSATFSQGVRAAVAAFALAGPLQAQTAQPGNGAQSCPVGATGEAAYRGAVFSGPSGYLDAATLAAISQQVAGCSVSRTDPTYAARLVNAAYEAFPAPLAFARPLEADDGYMTVELVEIRYNEIRVEDNDTTNRDYILGRANVRPGELAHVAALQDRLSQLPETEDIRIEADLEPGSVLNTSDLILRVEEPDPFRYTFIADNYGAEAQGRPQATLVGTMASVTGRRDPLTAILSKSEGKEGLSLSYTTPLGTAGTRLSFAAGLDRSGIVEGLPILRDLENETRTASMSLRHPLRADETASDFVTASIAATQDQAELFGFRIVDQDTRVISLGSSHTRRWPGKAVLNLSHELSWGQVDDAVALAEDSFASYSGFAALTYRIEDRVTGFSELTWHATNDLMPAALRFSVAGPNNVRGYEANEGSADAGFALRNQVSVSQPPDETRKVSFTPYAFVDLGQGYDVIDDDLKAQGLLASAGVGATWSFEMGAEDRVFTIDATLAKPLRSNGLTKDTDLVALLQMSVRF